MNRLYLILGYTGALPFFVFMVGAFFHDNKDIHLWHMGYATIILSFLGGIHWMSGIKNNNKAQVLFSMLPSIAGFGLMGWAIWIEPVFPLLAAAFLSLVLYWADGKFIDRQEMPDGYFTFRLKLTIIVSASLIISVLPL